MDTPVPTQASGMFTGDAIAYSVPVLRVADAQRSVEFYCGQLGFTQDWWHQNGAEQPAMVSISRGGATIHLTERTDVAFGGQVSLGTAEIETLWDQWSARGVTLELQPALMPWGFTEMHLRDPDGNLIRVMQPTGCEA
jgi:catechol 2,3-dioxygenase-like lactoylglutathione lyase family enzyme